MKQQKRTRLPRHSVDHSAIVVILFEKLHNPIDMFAKTDVAISLSFVSARTDLLFIPGATLYEIGQQHFAIR